ncbi:flagella basal body P-ring formation protein FlgA [Novosphingobium resinovorum]|uniref:flagella basal body P-ring formation protein FlgA n=1 Tax=Novosphingobium resinovorum TaxID=158500 RepID=UPI002ED48390|nr:flagella basal body P-ring formation protein FlgA [Novosphingobium resinovorum]
MSLSLVVLAATVSAQFADLDAIDRQVVAFTGAQVGQAGGAITPVDRRLRLRPCRTGMALSWRTPAQDSVVVQCGDAGGWRIFVPVRSAGGAAQAGPIAIARGDAVSIAVSGEGFTVSQPGEAMESGPVGGWIKVRPVSGTVARGDVMRARIERPGLVSVPLP